MSHDTVLENKSTSFLSAGICSELYQGYVYTRNKFPGSYLNKTFLRATYSGRKLFCPVGTFKEKLKKRKKKKLWEKSLSEVKQNTGNSS